MKRTLILIYLTIVATLTVCAGQCRILPQPVEYIETDGEYTVPKKLVDAMTDISSFKKAKSAGITFLSDASMGEEEYRLEVAPKGIKVTASGDLGRFYAMLSLAQMVRQADGDSKIQCCNIHDYPRFGYRGLMLDAVRYFIPKEEVLKLIDVAAQLKINKLHMHLTDDNGWRLEIKKYPKLTEVGAWRVHRDELFPARLNAQRGEATPDGGFYTQKDMREIVKYAAERRITVIPEIEMPAHAVAAIASYPELACPVLGDKFVGVFPGIGGKDASIILCAGNDKVFEFIENVIDEVVDIFPSEYINLGGDEANKSQWEKCHLCNQRMSDEHLSDYEALQGYFMDRVNRYVQSKGRKAIGWDEVTYGNPKEEIVILGWQGTGSVAVNYARNHKSRFIMTPAKIMYLIRYQGPQWFEPFTYFGNNTLHDVYHYEPVQDDWTDDMRRQLWGIQGSMWTEFCNSPEDVEYQLFPRLMAVADVAWRQEGSADWGGFLASLDAFLPILSEKGITYARSMYNIEHKVALTDGTLQATLSCIRPDVEIRYSDNGVVNMASSRYTSPIVLNGSQIISAATFKNGVQTGQTLTLDINVNKATAKPVKSPNYRNGLLYTLTNGLRGSDRCSDFEWAGWYNDNAEFVVDLGESTTINTVSLGTLINADLCVIAPKCVYVYASEDGKAYSMLKAIEVPEGKVYTPKATIIDLDCGDLNATARYIKVVAIHPGCIPDGYAREGQAGWMYFDEIMIK